MALPLSIPAVDSNSESKVALPSLSVGSVVLGVSTVYPAFSGTIAGGPLFAELPMPADAVGVGVGVAVGVGVRELELEAERD